MRASPPSVLASIIAHARAGALKHAWELFVASGFEEAGDDAAALTVKGRLLKDRAAASAGPTRLRLFHEAATAYTAAAKFADDPYPLVNAATLTLLAGDRERSKELAQTLLDQMMVGKDSSETPYYREATRAEALLLLGREPDARSALAAAVALAPRAWEDHASTLRQFALILAAQGGDPAWLDPLRPPRSAHFAGHMDVAQKGERHDAVQARVAALLAHENVGFGYGALAAGADIVIAEALVARGAELHVVVPGDPERFAAQSVEPFGRPWRARFDALIERAESVRGIAPFEGALTGAAVGVANQVAMGAALMNAARLATEAVQLLVIDEDGGGAADAAGAAESKRAWDASKRRGHSVIAPRTRAQGAAGAQLADDGMAAATAMLAVALPGDATRDMAGASATEARLREIASLLGEGPTPPAAPRLGEDHVLVACRTVAEAAALARQIVERGDQARVGADFGIAHLIEDPFASTSRLIGRPARLAVAAMRSTPPGSICVSEDFAAALEVSGAAAHSEFVGEMTAADEPAPIALYSLRAAPPLT